MGFGHGKLENITFCHGKHGKKSMVLMMYGVFIRIMNG
jgi:hypothetical protein